MFIRRLTKEDYSTALAFFDALDEMHCIARPDCFQKRDIAYPLDAFLQVISEPDCLMIGAFEEMEMLGLLRASVWREKTGSVCVDSLYVKPNADIYITGSNACLLSGDLATLLTGRYVEIKMLPLSFKEYLKITGMNPDRGLSEYMRDGGLPYIAVMDRTPEKVDTYLEGIYNTVIIKDIEDRQARKETDPDKRKITDVLLLKTIAKYLASVTGNPVSIRSITNYLISNGRKVSANTVSNYVEALTESFIFYPAERFDIVGKQLLKANQKLYIVDLGLRNHILPRIQYDLGFSLENLVYFELLRRGFRVMTGKVGNTEVDFVAEKQSTYTYFQVTADMTSKDTFDRELKPLSNIRDNYEKIVLTGDRLTIGNYNGIQVRNLSDWLLGK